jgi:uncharacterized protein with PIN domain
MGLRPQTRATVRIGDCFPYALARDKPEHILFKDNDFIQTDLGSAVSRHSG